MVDPVGPNSGRGNLTGDLNTINPVERNIVQELLDSGRDVELVPRSNTQTPDFLIDGVPTELKTLERAGRNTLKNAIQSASSQGDQILIDARNVPITSENAMMQIQRAQGSLLNDGRPSLNGRVTVLTQEGSVTF